MTMGNDDDDRDEDRRAILSRRSRFIALALSGLTSVGTAGCYDDHGRDDRVDAAPVPCLSDSGVPRDAGQPVPCLGAPLEDAGPTPCLEPSFDGGPDPSDDAGAEPADAGAPDAMPVPCLTRPAP
jgi:hypothetical protein